MRIKRNYRLFFGAWVIAALCGGVAGCGAGTPSTDANPIPDSRSEITWPPEAEATRIVSDDEIILGGSQFSASGGDISLSLPSEVIQFSPADTLSYTMYSLAGFSADISLESVQADYVIEDPIGQEGSTQLYFGISDYTRGAWTWYKGNPDSPEIIFPNPVELHSANGNLHLVVVLQGNGIAILSSIAFRRVGDTTLYPPENLVADPEVNQITLSWDPSFGAVGYNIYRNKERDEESYVKLNDALLLEATYLDDTVARNFIYYYRVSAVSFLESEMGERLDVYSPQEDLYFPGNPRVSSNSIDSFTITWDWEGELPDQWAFFRKEMDDFDLYTPIKIINLPNFLRSYTFHNLIPGKTYYWRMCGVSGGKRGRMTNDLPGITQGLWTWEPIEEIGPGINPISVVTVDNDLSVAYISGFNANFARRSDGFWASEVALMSMVSNGNQVITSVDLAYGNGKYVLVGLDFAPNDVVSATGTPGNWEQVRIDGDGNTGNGHPTSGSNLTVTANDSYFLATYLHDDALDFTYQITPIDDINWTSRTLLWPIYFGDIQYSVASTADNFYLLWYLFQAGNEGLKLHSYDDGAWNMVDIFPDGPSEIGHFNDLTMSSSGEWFSTAYDPSTFSMHFVNGTDAPWTSVPAEGSDRKGDNATMAAVGDRMFSVFKNRDQGFWMLGVYDSGVWEISPLSIPGVDIRRAKLAALGDTPYIIFHDQDGDIIKCAPGSPPV